MLGALGCMKEPRWTDEKQAAKNCSGTVQKSRANYAGSTKPVSGSIDEKYGGIA